MYFLLALLNSALVADGLSSLNLAINPTTIYSVASYTIKFCIDQTTPYDSTVQLTFPSQMTIADSANVACALSSIYGLGTVLCSVSSNIYTIGGLFGSGPDDAAPSPFTVSITLPSITNPSTTISTSPIGLATYNSGTLLESISSSALSITATAGIFTTDAITPQSNVIGASTSWLISFSSALAIPSGAIIQMVFPYWNSNIGAGTTSLLHFIRISSPSCSSVANIASALSASYSSPQLTLTITGGFTTSTTDTVQFNLNNVYNPPTSDTVSGFYIKILDSSYNSYITSNSISIQVTTANSISILTSYVYFSNATVSTSTYMLLEFIITNPTYSGVVVDISIPTEIVYSTSMVVSGNSNIASSLSYTSLGANSLRITNGFTAYSNSNIIIVMFNPITTPSSTKPTGIFTVTTRSPNLNAIDTGTGGVCTATAGNIYQYSTISLVTASDLTVGATTTYTFSMQLSHILPAGAAIVITFPSQISIAQRSSSYSCTSTIAGLNSAATCQVSSGVLTVLGGFPNGFSPGQVSFSIDQVTNPSSTAKTSTFTYVTYTNSSILYIIDQKTSSITFTSAVASLVSATVTPTSMITGSVTVYTFAITTKNSVPTNGYMVITFPSGVSISSTTNAANSCTKLSGFSSASLVCTATTSSLTVNGFSSGIFTAGQLSFAVGYVTNPPSTAPYFSFVIATYDSSGNGIDYKSSGISVTVTTANTLTAASVSIGSLVNSASTTYTFSLTVTNVTPTNAYVSIVAPSQVTLPNNFICAAVTNIATVSCSYVSSNTFTVSLTFSGSTIAIGTTISFSLASVINPSTTKQTDTFMIYTYTSAGYAIDQKVSGISIQTTTGSNITNILISADNSKISASTSYTVSYIPGSSIPAGTIIFVTIPSAFILGTINCTAVTISNSASCLASGTNLELTGGFPSAITATTTISFKINGITNPSTQLTTSAWSVTTITSDGSYIQQSNSLTSSFTCDTICLTCTLIPSQCTSCNINSAYPYFYSSSCHSSCLTGYYSVITSSSANCFVCSSICNTCLGSSTTCTSCTTGGSYPYFYSNSCNANCLAGYWGNGTSCILCTNPCNACSSGTFCINCTINTLTSVQTYLLNGVCYDLCPDGYISNSTSLACMACTSNCATCSGTISTCTSCISPYKLQNTSCVSSCIADGTYIDNGTVCQPCLSPCYSCFNNTSNCTSCTSSYYLYGNSCTKPCPQGYAGVNSKCFICTSPCDYCSGAPSVCTTCISGYLLQSSTCVTNCSSGYYSDGVNCNKCNSTCVTCTGSANSCTACSTPYYLLIDICTASCPSGTYVPTTGLCQPCLSPCATCSGSVTSCTSCGTGMVLYLSGCLSQCPDTISVLVGTACQICNSNCATCSGTVNTCTSCAPSLYIQNGTCVNGCSFGYILVNNACLACNSVCYSCSISTGNCTSCPSNNYLFQSTCVSKCPENYVPSLGACVQITQEIECSAGCNSTILYNYDCDAVCNVAACAYDNGKCNVGPVNCGSNQFEANNSCFTCSNPCGSCISAANLCTSCLANSTGGLQYLYNYNCYSSCPSKTVVSGVTCADCDSRCSACSGTNTTCISCVNPYFLYDNQCIIECLAGITVSVNSTYCVDCSSNCKTCANLYNQCTSCASNSYLQGTVCQPYCNSGYYSDSNQICQLCSGCSQCIGSATNCTSCISGQYLYGNECVLKCPSGTYTSTSTCNACMTSCATCSNSGQCDTCINGLLLFSTVCVSSCPTSYVGSVGICVLSSAVSLCNQGCTTDLLVNNVCDAVCKLASCNNDELQCLTVGSCGYGQYNLSGTCTPCQYPCKECSSSTSCLSCVASVVSGNLLLLNGTSCIEIAACTNGYVAVGVFCTICSNSCKTCSGSTTTCVSCNSGTYLYNGTCVSSCPPLITVTIGSACIECMSNCQTCSGSYDNCTLCPTGKVLQNSVCVTTCFTGYSVTTATPYVCQLCTGNCLTCANESYKCTSCLNQLYLYGTDCVTLCPNLTTIIQGYTCIPCASPCLTCISSITECTQCIANYSLYNSQCLNPCPNGYQDILGNCTPLCAQGCTIALLYNKVCDLPCNVEACLYDNSACLVNTSCSVGQYQSGTLCINCTSPCNTCASSVYCSSCIVANGTQMYLYQGTCYSICPAGTYLNGLSCFTCNSSCATCTTSSSYCTSCPSGMKLYGSTCINSCPSGSTIEKSNVCYSCDNTCKYCAGTINICTSCPVGAVLSKGSCLPECPPGYTTTSSSNGACITCSSCLTCLSSESYCTSCSQGYILYQNQCITKCPSGYTNITTNPTTCTQCSSNCDECQNTISTCIACPSGQLINSINQCQVAAACPNGYTTTSSALTTCSACIGLCVTCKDSTSACTSCNSGYYLSGTTCLPCNSNCLNCSGTATTCTACKNGLYLAGSNSCMSCDISCNTCFGASNNCTTCGNTLYLNNNACFGCSTNCSNCVGNDANCISCPDGYYLVGNKCLPCNSNCSTCNNTATYCTGCKSHYYVASSRTCQSCSSSCGECQGSPTLCTACTSPMVLINNQCGNCLSTCGSCNTSFSVCTSCSGSLTLINGVCGNCTSNCLTCQNSFSYCTSCNNGRYLVGGTCQLCSSNCVTCLGTSTNCTSCLASKSLINNVCVTCNNPCVTCAGTKDTCTSCNNGTYLSNGSCFACYSTCTGCFTNSSTCTGCVNGYYLSGNACNQCSNLCVTCNIEQNYCTSCISSANLVNGVCLINCKSGYIQIGLSCEPCAPSCLTCSGTVDSCTTCASGIIYNNGCVNSCPVGYYVSNGGCQPCSSNCKECTTTSVHCITCNSGYSLKSDNTCQYVCSPGQFSNGGVCQDCDKTCKTCDLTSISCTSCSNSSYTITSDGLCVESCATGYVRTNSSQPCQACNSQCGACSGSVSNCLNCSDPNLFLYKNLCIAQCPTNTTVDINGICEACGSTCQFCSETPFKCTSCYNGTYLYISTCVSTCPYGYKISGVSCIKCYNASNCTQESPSSTNITNQTTNTSATTFTGKPVPFPFSIVSFLSATVIGVTKLTSIGVQFVSSTIAVWGVMSFGSWAFLSIYVPIQGTQGSSRRLADIQAIGGNAILTVAFFLILGALIFHVCCNFLFSITYSLKVSRKDRTYKYWKKHHPKINLVAMVLSYLVSFHCIRILFCGLCDYDGFKVVYDKKNKVYKPLIKYGYVSILCTFVPLIIAQILILTELEVGRWLWMFTLDSLFITFFLAILIVVDLKRREQELLRHEIERELGPLRHIEDEELMNSSNSVKELIDMFPQLDFTSLVPAPTIVRKLKKKWISVSNPVSKVSTPTHTTSLPRRGSFPLLATDQIELKPELLIPEEKKPEIIDEPYGEEILEKDYVSEDLTILQEEEEPIVISPEMPEVPEIPEEPKEFETSITEYKDMISRPFAQVYVPLDIEPKTEEFTEIVAFTEEDERISDEEIIQEVANEENKVEEFDIEHEVEDPKQSRTNLLQEEPSQKSLYNDSGSKSPEKELSQISPELIQEDIKDGDKDLGLVNEEKDIDLDKAIADSKDPELITVINKQTGERITIRKGFKGARIVDLENKVIENIAPIDTNKYEVSRTIVDDTDVRFATMTGKGGEKVRVKRSFKGARIVDLEKKVAHPHSFLIGQNVKNEADFQFSNAYPDPDDPEVVVVMHNETGEDVKIRKTFHGAQVVDEAGDPVPDLPGIDRNDYDIPKTIVDKEDVHIATLKHKITHAKVKVRRNFRGAKIVDLERKVDLPLKGLARILSENSENSEPEPLSQEISQHELMNNELGWITPSYPKKSSPKQTKKNPLKPIAITPKNDEGYDRRKLANLANLIDDLEEESKDWQQPEPYRFISESSDDEKSIGSIRPQRKSLYHNVDLDTVYPPEFKQEPYEPEQFPSNEKRRPKKKKKKTKKPLPTDPQRMKGLEDIYLQRLEGKKKYDRPSQMKYTNDGTFFEPEWERTDSAFDYRPTTTERALTNAAEEIINPRFKISTPRKDY